MKAFIAILFVAIAAVATAADLPTQVHIALAGQTPEGDSNSMAISWHTEGTTPTSTVKYGTSSGVYSNTASGVSKAYYETYNHHAVLGALAPATTYYYIVGDDSAGWSTERSFRSAPLSNSLRGNFSFFVFGDLGVVNGDPTLDYINANKDSVSLVWHGGDVSYADDSFLHKGCVTEFCFEKTFDEYMDKAEPWASLLPYMVTPGNHEAGTCARQTVAPIYLSNPFLAV